MKGLSKCNSYNSDLFCIFPFLWITIIILFNSIYTFQQLKRKNEVADFEADSGDRMNPGSTEAANTPFQTPISGKMGKGGKSSRLTKCNRTGPQTPGSNIGEFTFQTLYTRLLYLWFWSYS